MKKFITSFLLLAFIGGFAQNLYAAAETVWADDSINDDIVKIYNTNAINEEFLPSLPDSLKNETKSPDKIPNVQAKPSQTVQKAPAATKQAAKPTAAKTASQPQTPKYSNDYVLIKKGTKFRLRLETPVNDSASIGSKVYFTSLYPEVNKYITIPAGTRFVGTIEDSHMPQISANGGLLVIKVDEFIYKGHKYPIESKVIMVGDKRIFQNNIKGKHTYWKSVAKSTSPGRKFYKKSWRLTKKFAGDGLEIILTPVTFVGGAAVFAVNTAISPAVALFSKGNRLFINKGTRFQIKLTDDTAVYL